MLTLEDCIALSGLTREEVDAIAEHEHLPEIVATELRAYLMQLPEGGQAIKAMIRDDIAQARMRGDFIHSAKLNRALPRRHRQSRMRACQAAARSRSGDAIALEEGVISMSQIERFRYLAECWRRLAELGDLDQKSFRLAWADHLDCLARLEAKLAAGVAVSAAA